MTEFQWCDRVKWSQKADQYGEPSYGTVVDEHNPLAQPILGSFRESLPQPVAVFWDERGETWWTPGDELELA